MSTGPDLLPRTETTTPGATAPRPSDGPRSGRFPRAGIALVAVVVIVAAAIMVWRSGYRDGPLEPSSPGPVGTKAVTRVLERAGADVDTVRRTSDAARSLRSGATVVVNAPDTLNETQLRLLADARDAGRGRLVLLSPGDAALRVLAPGTTVADDAARGGRVAADSRCGDASFAARRVDAGPIAVPSSTAGGATSGVRTDEASGARTLPARTYAVVPGSGAAACFASGGGAAIVRDGRVTVLGSAAMLVNDRVLAADDAAIALNALGAGRAPVTWYLPSALDPMSSASRSLDMLLPPWLLPSLLWGAFAAVIALVAAGHRLGPVVVEPLPVRVRAQELVVGRARLAERSRDREGSARALRDAAAQDCAALLGVTRAGGIEELLAALSERSTLRPGELRALLVTRPIRTDAQLVALADELDRLTKEIRR